MSSMEQPFTLSIPRVSQTVSLQDVAGHCVSPMSCALRYYSFPEPLETCTRKNQFFNDDLMYQFDFLWSECGCVNAL